MQKRVFTAALLLTGLCTASCTTNEHHSPDGQTPPSMGDYNNACNPHSQQQIGSHLPRKDLSNGSKV